MASGTRHQERGFMSVKIDSDTLITKWQQNRDVQRLINYKLTQGKL